MAQRIRFSTQAVQHHRHGALQPWVESLANLDAHRASFETPAARAPQDEDFS
jgi:hypothetical protein